MTMKETVQAISWGIEIVVFVTAVVVGRYLWRYAKRVAAKEREGRSKVAD